MASLDCLIGTAGWSLPRAVQHEFPATGSHLTRYASRFNAVEINSSFHRPHRHATYARWAEEVPSHFAFAAKLPRTITHDLRLIDAQAELDAFAAAVSGLGTKLRCLLIQLPPSLDFDEQIAEQFLGDFRDRFDGTAVIEARHAGWFARSASELLSRWNIGRVRPDPLAVSQPVIPTAPIRYYRLHGSPRMYYSQYPKEALHAMARELHLAMAANIPTWCMFDNTTLGHAASDALALQRVLPEAG